MQKDFPQAFNCTIEELKLMPSISSCLIGFAFNCTIEELKLIQQWKSIAIRRLLIVP